MCLSPKVPKDNSAQIAREQEDARQARITQGKSNIDSTFGNFNDDFFGGITKNYNDYYLPQVDEQYNKALEQIKYGLARQGNTESSAAGTKLGDAEKLYLDTRTDIGNKAVKAANDARTNVEQQRSSLYDLNTSAADPSLVASRASAAATGLQAPPALSPIGEVFASLLNQGSNAVSLAQNGYNGWGLNLPTPNYSLNTKPAGGVVN